MNMIWILFTLSLVRLTEAIGPKCFSCQRVPFPRDCESVAQCGEFEECSVEELVTTSGHFIYNTGCRAKERCTTKRNAVDLTRARRSDISTCLQCCTGDYCNNNGCGTTGIIGTRGPYCFTCDYQRDPSSCDKVKVCNIGEQCLVHGNANFVGLYDHLYTSNCATKAQCSTLQVAHWSKGLCSECCNTDFCNVRCAVNITISPQPTAVFTISGDTTSQPSPTAVSTTKPSTALTRQTTVLQESTTMPTPHQSATSSHSVSHGTCGTGYIPVSSNGHSTTGFKFVHQNVTWYDAVIECNRMCGSLAIIDTHEKLLNVAKFMYLQNITLHNHYVWIGLHERYRHGHYYWQTSDQPLNLNTFQHWGQGHPIPDIFALHPTKCAVMGGDEYSWYERDCNIKGGFVCEQQHQKVDGSWTVWFNKDTCHSDHYHIGNDRKIEHMYRMCSNPPPSGGGMLCQNNYGTHQMKETSIMHCHGHTGDVIG